MRKNRRMPPQMFARYDLLLRQHLEACAAHLCLGDPNLRDELLQAGRVALWSVPREKLHGPERAGVGYLRRVVFNGMLMELRDQGWLAVTDEPDAEPEALDETSLAVGRERGPMRWESLRAVLDWCAWDVETARMELRAYRAREDGLGHGGP